MAAKSSLAVLLVCIGVKAVGSIAVPSVIIPLYGIAICAAVPALLFSEERVALVKRIDWHTLVFFASMFIVMAAVWDSGFFQSLIGSERITEVPVILGLSVVLSQFISNVPFVALFQPLIIGAGSGATSLMALAAGSTIAGNLTILGAASNVIIIQQAEREGSTLTFREFVRVGIPLTILQLLVYWVFLSLF
jgi:Na+/H+ antiporter NhaD/arsenite permease-like protein